MVGPSPLINPVGLLTLPVTEAETMLFGWTVALDGALTYLCQLSLAEGARLSMVVL